MMKNLWRSRRGTAEIVGTTLFLVILMFFFSNVFLWHNQVTREMDQVIADKANSTVRLEVTTGARGLCSGETINYGNPDSGSYEYTWQADGKCRVISEKKDSPRYKLNVTYSFSTGIDTSEKLRSVENVSLNVNASFTDTLNEECYIFIMNWTGGVWVATGLSVQEQDWYVVTISDPETYIDYRNGGDVSIMFVDASSQQGFGDNVAGTLYVDYMEVLAEPVVLEVTNLGGLDAALSRLWIVSSSAHVFADLQALNVWVAGGAKTRIILGSETRMNGRSVEAEEDGGDVVVYYVPPAGERVTFRILTEYGNTGACSYGFY